MTTSVTVRLCDEHIEWLRAHRRSVSDAIREAIDLAIRDESYRKAHEVLARIPLDTEDDWGDPDNFMLRAGTHER